ncbi:uncharacterized protein LOC126090494 [Schistocerca cancellata]|uniref:uncharacterized protein LOC126090494 n=1 Tax=Schistocerca cancellata TaxID=274614 RepID=UPI002118D8EA|nr:uncharacterized protein LOC126090494 [Schistocerca cancellata]
MGSPCHLSDSNVRTRYGKPTRSSKKSGAMYSDYYEEQDNPTITLAQRSVSMTALQGGGVVPLQPRMAQLETLEAKMASIEVSLSTTATTTPRRKKVAASSTGSAGGVQLQRASRDVARELEALRNALRDKENVIQSLKGQLCNPGRPGGINFLRGGGSVPLASDCERRAARDRLNRLRQDMDNKRLAIKNLALALERLDVSDNIDARIQQAELEFQLGREELNLLSLLEEARALQTSLEEIDSARNSPENASLFSCVSGADRVTLHAISVDYDVKSPRFGASTRDSAPGLYVEWAAADCGIIKGDRLLEVNGKLVMSGSKSAADLQRLLSVSPAPAQLVVLRTHSHSDADSEHGHQSTCSSQLEVTRERERAEDAERDNVRLSHRISYLEEQVAELRRAATAATSTHPATAHGVRADITAPTEGLLQVFQKGPQVTALVANLPGMASPKNCLPTLRPKSRTQDSHSSKSLDFGGNSDCSSSGGQFHHHNHHHYHRHNKHSLHSARSTNSLDASHTRISASKHLLQPRSRHQLSETHKLRNGHHTSDSYNLDGSDTLEQQKHTRHKDPEKSHHHRKSDNGLPTSEHKSTTRNLRSVNETLRDGKICKSYEVRSVKSMDSETELRGSANHNQSDNHDHTDNQSSKSSDYTSESSVIMLRQNGDNSKLGNNSVPRETKPQRPTPPKKPLRLSLQRATSLQSVTLSQSLLPAATQLCSTDTSHLRKLTKRNHRTEDSATANDRTPSRAESCQSALRWPPSTESIHQNSLLNTSRTSIISTSGNSEKWY